MSQKPGLTIQKAVTMIKPWLFPLGVACLYAAGFLLAPENTEKALGKSGTIFRQLGFPLCLCLVMMVVLNRFLSPKTITRLLGKGSGIKGLVISSLAGILSMSPVYAWYPMLKTMKDKGAANFHLANFIGSRSVKPVLLPVLVGYLGWRFAGLFVLACLAGSFMTAGLVSLVCSESSSR
ncbi:MAG: hypothetical protein HUK40_12755 [Desulfobacter sp.]|nr:hypothetical protein [Desulfobacter sp.]